MPKYPLIPANAGTQIIERVRFVDHLEGPVRSQRPDLTTKDTKSTKSTKSTKFRFGLRRCATHRRLGVLGVLGVQIPASPGSPA
jgi:hypothetical protein